MARINLTFDLNSPGSDKIAAAVGAALDGDLAPAKALGAEIERVPDWLPDEDDEAARQDHLDNTGRTWPPDDGQS